MHLMGYSTNQYIIVQNEVPKLQRHFQFLFQSVELGKTIRVQSLIFFMPWGSPKAIPTICVGDRPPDFHLTRINYFAVVA